MKDILTNQYFVVGVMSVLIFTLTQLFKYPIKAVTKRIKNDRARRIANITILLIPFALGVVLEFVYSTYIMHTPSSQFVGLGYGTAGVSLYSVIERFFKVPNPYNTADGEAVTQLVDDVRKDGEVDEKDRDAIKEFWEKVK
jgi:archaellum biogenesis protein FlaJ (TadC family)